ncbi:MAG TPA: hypothetical protein VN969_22160 [Streptosporangiaceae bacterium]|nr:hypothetical protein [Streptosporangiaceae bacterium]
MDPGVVFVSQWRPDPDHDPTRDARSIYYGLLARKP